jgi:hypothetical protein
MRRQLGVLVEEDVAVPMRDGIVLRADVFRPETDGRFPGLLMRTPYGKRRWYGAYDRFVQAGYAVVLQDTRGRYASEGTYVPFTVEGTGDAEDGYDSVEWLAEQPFCDGSVGTFGSSYNAWMQWELARLRPPHLKAMAACTIPLECFQTDWPAGGFKPARRVHWWMATIAPDLRRREGLSPPHTWPEGTAVWSAEHGKWLGLLPWMAIAEYLPEGLASYVRDWLAHPNRRPWRFDEAHKEIDVPNLDVTGWFDHCNATIGHLGGMQAHARTEVARSQTKLIIGPWNHTLRGQRSQGDHDFGPQAEVDIDGLTLRWFDHWLKEIDNGIHSEPAVRYYVLGRDRWESSRTWPPEGTRMISLYLGSRGNAGWPDQAGVLRDELPDSEGMDRYLYDPRNPVPTIWTRDLMTLPVDRRCLEHRDDILYFRTPPLDEDLQIVGHPQVILYAASSAIDTDFFAHMVDEDPEGMALEVSYGMVRARHRASLDREEFLAPGQVTEFHIDMGPVSVCFRRGHCIRLEITSSNFPNHDRNHNVGRDDLSDAELRAATQEIVHSAKHPSRLELPVSS